MVYAAVRAPARQLGYFFPAASAASRSSSFFCEGPADKYSIPHVYTCMIYIPFAFVSRSLRPCVEQTMCSVFVPIEIQDQRKTYAACLFANEAPLSLDFF